jgi:hypothetical protein
MKKSCILFISILLAHVIFAQKKKEQPTAPVNQAQLSPSKSSAGPKKYEEVITDKAITKKGLFTVHKVDDKWYFEIPDTAKWLAELMYMVANWRMNK